jgi:hypothetical protein
VKGFSSFLNNSTNYWKETFNNIDFCKCPDNQKINDTDNNDNDINEKKVDKSQFLNKNPEYVNQIFTDKRGINLHKNNFSLGKIECKFFILLFFRILK